MITFKKQTTETEVADKVICDKCGRVFEDELEIQEFIHIRFIGGYGSVFGYDQIQEVYPKHSAYL